MPEITCREAALSEDYYDFLISNESLLRYRPDLEFCTQTIDPNASCFYSPRTQNISFPQQYYFPSIPHLYGLMEGTVSDAIQSIDLQQTEIPGLDGTGVLIGIIGTGIHYDSPYFSNSDGSTRIIEIWDQTDQTGTPPPDIVYGSVYTEEDINLARNSETPTDIVPVTDPTGYGTYLASATAASANESGSFRGVAPASSLAVVKLKPAKAYLKEYYAIPQDATAYQENDIMLAIKYLRDLALRKGMPLCICLGPGSSMGNHNGNTFLSRYIDSISIGQKCVITGTGNEANQRHHFEGNFLEGTEYIDVEVRVDNNSTGFWMELWGMAPDVYSISVISPSGEILPRIPYRLGTTADHRFAFEGSELSISYPIIEQNIGNTLITIRMRNPANGIWTFRIYDINLFYGQFHMWLPISDFLQGETYFLASNPDMTLTDPSSANRSITVSAYNSLNNSLFVESGRGYTLTNVIKPYVASPGVSVPGITLRDTIIRRSGTAGSAALTTGACALIFQWTAVLGNDPAFGAAQMSTLLIRGATRSPGRTYPNRGWGYGTLDLQKMFESFRPV